MTIPDNGRRLIALLALAMGAIALHLPAHADAGHDHGDEAPAAAGRALPRFTAESENFELVGVLEGRRLTLYLDRFADNSPVKDARLELQLGDEKLVPEAHGEGSFDTTLAHVPPAGVLPVTATVTTGRETDLLAGDFDLHDAHADADAEAPAPAWRRYAPWLAAGIAGLVLAVAGWRLSRRPRHAVEGGAA
ncbi:Uncharacterised protein [Xylophilus ampelinus]|nr:hypothetical protein [Variovorax sp.]VTY33743.1 Uncharacterised protein [Xylophilus ampelinus]